jgi:hypothetical protein
MNTGFYIALFTIALLSKISILLFITLNILLSLGVLICLIKIGIDIRNKAEGSSKAPKLILILSFLSLVIINYSNRKQIVKIYRSLTELEVSSSMEINPCACDLVGQIKKDEYSKHRFYAKKVTNNRFIKDNAVLKKLIDCNHLVDVRNNKGYAIAPLQHSSKHLTIKSYMRLVELGKRFHDSMELLSTSNAHFVVSSLTRTEYPQQQELRPIENGATKGTSTHSYGVSFDISKVVTNGDCAVAQKILIQTLKSMKAENKILICPEFKCVHVTVIN